MMLLNQELTISTLLRVFRKRIFLTWGMIFSETALMALIPLFIGYAIDGLMAGNSEKLFLLAGLMGVLIVASVLRRAYDTRIYGTIRVEMGRALAERSKDLPVSKLNARLGMGRELVDFLEETLPMAMASVVQLIISVVILFTFSPTLAFAGGGAVVVFMLMYALFHRQFFRLNKVYNHQAEKQVGILDRRDAKLTNTHLLRLRGFEVRLSDTEAILYGAIFVVLLGYILFNLWFATTKLTVTVGAIFSIVSYSWEFVNSALALPITLQSWSRLSEIMARLNGSKTTDVEE